MMYPLAHIPQFFLATVKSVQSETGTVSCTPLGQTAELKAVKLTAATGQVQGALLQLPKVGSQLLCCQPLNATDTYALLLGDVEKVILQNGENSEAVNWPKVLDEMKKMNDRVNAIWTLLFLSPAQGGWTPTPQDGGAAIKTTFGASPFSALPEANLDSDEFTNPNLMH